MSNGFIYVVDTHFIDKIERKKILDPSACGQRLVKERKHLHKREYSLPYFRYRYFVTIKQSLVMTVGVEFL
jgi:hypothetical protein